jgi:hypothetical protein
MAIFNSFLYVYQRVTTWGAYQHMVRKTADSKYEWNLHGILIDIDN